MRLYEKINNNEVYIIAEMSANHAGKIENAYKIIEEAAKAGADCVKIQTYTADTLTIDCSDDPYVIKGGLWDGYNYYKLYQEAMTPWEWQADLKKKCEEVGVDFLSTPFDNTAVDFLEDIDVEFYKIASFELVDIPLIEYIASKGKPIVLSCGMASKDEIEEALEACNKYKNDKVVLLKCCSQYPADYCDMNLLSIKLWEETYNKPIGLSDHSLGSLAPVVAVSLGARVIEKHVKLNDSEDTPDTGFSMTMDEFAQMVKDVKKAKSSMGITTLEPSLHDIESRGGRRSLVAIKNIHEGELFTKDNIKSVRPSIGIKPKYYNELLGKKSKRSYKFGEPIQMCEVE